jgi:DNA polymerase-3 subunit epsilon
VYLFRNLAGEVIYIGKAKELRARVRSYFYGDPRRRITQMMRELAAVDHQVCPTEIDAAVTEIRLIDRHVPRYNSRSRPTGSAHWVRLTDERFPRLSVVRTQHGKALAHLGPFRRRATAEAAVAAIWDAVPIRRCVGRSGGPRCRYAQLGVAVCPCDGSVDPADYASMVAIVRDGITGRPELLLDPLLDRMRSLAASRRFEQAADVRDRCRALAAAIDTRRAWQALDDAGMVWAEDAGGDAVAVDRGRLAAAWARPDPPPLLAAPTDDAGPETPPSNLAAEELRLLWRWLDRPGVVVVHSTAPLRLPSTCAPAFLRGAARPS